MIFSFIILPFCLDSEKEIQRKQIKLYSVDRYTFLYLSLDIIHAKLSTTYILMVRKKKLSKNFINWNKMYVLNKMILMI